MSSSNRARTGRRSDAADTGVDAAKGVELYTLGGVRLLRGGIDETSKLGARHLALLIYLFHERRPMHPSEVTELLGRGQSQEKETEALRRAISYLTDKISGVGIRVVAETVETFGGVLLDTREVDAAIDGGDPWHVARLWVGDFLQGFESGAAAFDEWAEKERTRLRRAWSNAILSAARKAEERGDWETAAQWWLILVGRAPGRAESVARLMRAYGRSGRLEEAARTYAEYVALVGEDTSGPPEAIQKVLTEFPKLPALARRRDLPTARPPSRLPVKHASASRAGAEALEGESEAAPVMGHEVVPEPPARPSPDVEEAEAVSSQRADASDVAEEAAATGDSVVEEKPDAAPPDDEARAGALSVRAESADERSSQEDAAWEGIVEIASTDEFEFEVEADDPATEPGGSGNGAGVGPVLPEEVVEVSSSTAPDEDVDGAEAPGGEPDGGGAKPQERAPAAFTDTRFEGLTGDGLEPGRAGAAAKARWALAARIFGVFGIVGRAFGAVGRLVSVSAGVGARAIRRQSAKASRVPVGASVSALRRFWYVPVGAAAIGLAVVVGLRVVGGATDLSGDLPEVRPPALPDVSLPKVTVPKVTVKAPSFVETSVARIGDILSGPLLKERGAWVVVADVESGGSAAHEPLAAAVTVTLETELSESRFFSTVPHERALIALDRVSGGTPEKLSFADALSVAQDMGYAMVVVGRIIPGTATATATATADVPEAPEIVGRDASSVADTFVGSVDTEMADSAHAEAADSIRGVSAGGVARQTVGMAALGGAEASRTAPYGGMDAGAEGLGKPQNGNVLAQVLDTSRAQVGGDTAGEGLQAEHAETPDSAAQEAPEEPARGGSLEDSAAAVVPDSLQLSIFTPSGQEVYGVRAELSEETGGLSVVEALVNALRRRLGEPGEEVEASPGAGELFSLSVEALSAYRQARMHLYTRRYAQVIRAAREATRYDSTLAAAYQIQAEAYAQVGQRMRGRSMLEAAYRLRRRAPERERFRIQADRLAWDGREEEAIVAYEELFRRYRDDVGALKAQALLQWQIGVRGGGEGNLRVAYMIDPLDWPPLVQLARYLGYRRPLPDVDSLVATLDSSGPRPSPASGSP